MCESGADIVIGVGLRTVENFKNIPPEYPDTKFILMDEAVDSLAQAKAMHDDLEALYNPYVDFGLVESLAARIGDEILSL